MDKIRALIDTNVLLDHLAHREGFCQDAAVIFSMVDEGQLIGIVSSLSIVNCAYVLPKHYDGDAVLEQIRTMLKMFTISNVDASVLEQAADIEPYDYEDAVQNLSALPYHPDMVITRDKKGFNNLNIQVMTPSEFVNRAKQQ
ncbi:MAG: PIN domain-containing protein [Prevotella sp.]|nr:PIN domain-containing protein [Prevotella sp.]